MIKDLNDLIPELKPFFRGLKALRIENGRAEFALDSFYGISWFPISMMPEKAEDYLRKILKLEGLI